jgi:hypothetical protein
MTPQEKAKQIIEMYESGLTIKDCALIAVDEILSNPMFFSDWGTLYFWQSVKKEIEKL